MIKRKIAEYVDKVAKCYPVVTIMGPRQSGKTTLAQAQFPAHQYRNLEAEDVLSAAKADPRRFLMNGSANMVIDEIQRFPSLLTYIQEMVDANRIKGQFVLTGSHQPELGAAVSESLAGRTGICTLMPLSIEELKEGGIAVDDRDGLMWHGFMPRMYDDAIEPGMLYRDYFQTYVQRDVRRIVNIQDIDAFTVFMRLLAGRVGQLLNKDSLARDVGISTPTVMKWLSVLEASFMIYRLRPYHGNFGKRQTKAQKIYFTETGLATYLLGIRDKDQLFTHPLVGSLFENMVVMEAVKFRLNRGCEPDLWFYRNSSGTTEVDLLMEDGTELRPREIKSSSTYSQRMGDGLARFLKLSPNAVDPRVVYAGGTFDGVAVNFADVSRWCM
ncbi:MAG: ATP-binding protein [Kiritimatiellae bacterium]|nr:ATP-binding protein [Kiritimatiellia bacterium]